MRKISWTISISNVPLPPLSLSCSSSYNFAKFVCKFITEFAKTYKIIGIFKNEYNVKMFLRMIMCSKKISIKVNKNKLSTWNISSNLAFLLASLLSLTTLNAILLGSENFILPSFVTSSSLVFHLAQSQSQHIIVSFFYVNSEMLECEKLSLRQTRGITSDFTTSCKPASWKNSTEQNSLKYF